MTRDVEHEQVQELLGAFALDAVDPDEARLVEAHLADCPRCRAEVDAHIEVAGALGNTVDLAPGGLWDRIAQEIEGSERVPSDELTRPGFTRLVARRDELASARVRRAGQGAPWRQRALAALTVAAAIVALVFGLQLQSANNNLSSTRSALAAKGDAAAVTAALATPGHQLIAMRSAQGNEVAEFVLLPDGRGYLVSSRMSTLPRDETYQLWGKIEGQPISLALLGNHPAHAGFTVASATPSSLLVTVEPAGGVTAPDRAPLATGVVTRA
jgi:Anti-sigma-K factor rskA/Putative zinc-finger